MVALWAAAASVNTCGRHVAVLLFGAPVAASCHWTVCGNYMVVMFRLCAAVRAPACCCRVTAMVRLEGLVKGGAAGDYEGCFMEHLRMLKDPLLDQMVDRCVYQTTCSIVCCCLCMRRM